MKDSEGFGESKDFYDKSRRQNATLSRLRHKKVSQTGLSSSTNLTVGDYDIPVAPPLNLSGN